MPPADMSNPPWWAMWSQRLSGTTVEVVALSCGINPGVFTYNLRKRDQQYEEFHRRLEIVADYINRAELPHTREYAPLGDVEKILLSDLAKLAKKLGWPLPSQFPKPEDPVADAPAWPWGGYQTKLLAHLAAAAEHFWAHRADSALAPTNDVVAAWLIDRGVSARRAGVMAQILRSDTVPPGPRKK